MPNRLSRETSPYLRQHAENPVDWFPWGDEALAKARSEDKPILLSVGYSACHWCHVMAHECFENPEIAAAMNERFINIKVDREERPDLDQIYQNVSQLLTRGGGWPLTVFLTPELKPYFGGTYFPPEDRYGRPGFPRVLQAISDAYRLDRDNVAENAKRLTDTITQIERGPSEGKVRPSPESLRKACDQLLASADWHNGGFGGAPKFPNAVPLTFLWRFGRATGFGMAQDLVVDALTKMARGGIYDHVGGGFHRYTVDGAWAIPHFEKMLYDNALLLKLYAEVTVGGAEGVKPAERELHVRALAETTRYVLREMRAPEGGFYSAQDADSEGHEGKFFVWTPRSLREVLSENEASAIETTYGVTEAGNFENKGETVLALSASTPPGDAARTALLAEALRKLFAAREKRVKPGRDEKSLASWNGLMISGLSWASRALRAAGDATLADEALAAARGGLAFVRSRMSRDDGRLWSVFAEGKARFNAYLDDYAFLALGALDLARVTPDGAEAATLATQARAWVDTARARFADPAAGGFFMTSDDHEQLLVRPKSIFDQAVPSGNGVLLECLVALGELFPDSTYAFEADEHLSKLFPVVEKAPMGAAALASAGLLFLAGPVTITGPRAAEACDHPNVFQKGPESDASAAPRDLVICHRRTCDTPQADVAAARVLAHKKTQLR